jgi:ketosteroid isomerase-like protein
MTNTQESEKAVNDMILKGEGMVAFEQFYADDCEMQENTDAPRVGKDACRAYEVEFFGNIQEFHGAELHYSAVDGDRSHSEWTFDMTFKDGTRMRNTQIAARTWRDGKLTSERFFYKPNVVTA